MLQADDLKTLGGKSGDGHAPEHHRQGNRHPDEGGPVATPFAQVLALDIRKAKGIAPGAKYTDVRLLDDTRAALPGGGVPGQHGQADVAVGRRGQDAGRLSDRLDGARRPGPGARRSSTSSWPRRAKRDRIVILRDGELNTLEGTLGDIDAKGTSIQFKRDGADGRSRPVRPACTA